MKTLSREGQAQSMGRPAQEVALTVRDEYFGVAALVIGPDILASAVIETLVRPAVAGLRAGRGDLRPL